MINKLNQITCMFSGTREEKLKTKIDVQKYQTENGRKYGRRPGKNSYYKEDKTGKYVLIISDRLITNKPLVKPDRSNIPKLKSKSKLKLKLKLKLYQSKVLSL